MKKKRIVTKKGDVFCADIEDSYKVYFQYIGNDMTQLNSSVIRVFKKHYDMGDNPSMDEIVSDDVSFYAHTMLRVGIEQETWYKVGKHIDVGDENDAHFRVYGDRGFGEIKKSYRWYVWTMNNPMVFVGEMTEKYMGYDMGSVFPDFLIIGKIKTGIYPGKGLQVE